MKFDKQIKSKYDKETDNVSISITITEDVVVVKKVTSDQYRKILAHMNSVLYDIDNK